MSDHYEYYLNNPHEVPAKDDDMEWVEDAIEDEADKFNFVYDLLADEYVDFELTRTTLRAMFKSYCTRVHSNKKDVKEQADKDLLIFTKSLMSAMYAAAEDIIIQRGS
jgi:hypothetical protein